MTRKESVPPQLQHLLRRTAVQKARIEVVHGFSHHHLPSATGSDFHFEVYLFDQMDPTITAILERDPKMSLWDATFESSYYRDENEQYAEYAKAVEEILENLARIIQRKKGWEWEFEMQVELEGVWQGRGKVLVTRLPFYRVPKIASREKIYHSSCPSGVI